MELFDGHLFVHLNLGTGAAKVRASRKPLNDGNWHRVELTLKNKVGRITVDGTTEAFESPAEYLTNTRQQAIERFVILSLIILTYACNSFTKFPI